MKTDHPEEEMLQQYAIGKLTNESSIRHINNCEHCKQQVMVYQFIAKEIEQDVKPKFEFDLAAEMITQIAAQTAPPKIYWKDSILIILVFTCLATPLYLYRDSILSIFSGSSATLVFAICTTAISVLVWQIISLSYNYQRQIKALDLAGRLQH